MVTARSGWKWIAASCAILVGCGDETSGLIADGAVDGDSPADLVTAPAVPWYDSLTAAGEPEIAPPVFLPCPEGWRVVRTETGVEVCDPFPEGGPATCAPDQAHFPGEPGCTTLGSACPSGDFPEGLPTGATVRYVLAGAPSGGDGSLANPFSTIGEATAIATPGTIIAVGKGRYDELVNVPGGVTLWGACVGETVLTRSAGVVPGFVGGVITVNEPEATVRNLHLADGELIGVWVSAPGTLSLHDFLLSGCRTQGVLAEPGARIQARSVVVRDMRPRARDDMGGQAFTVESDGVLDLSRIVIERVMVGGVVGLGGDVRTEDIVVRDVMAEIGSGENGHGIISLMRGRLDVSRALVESVAETGIGAQNLVMLTASHVVVRNSGGGVYAGGISLRNGATGTLSKILLEDDVGDGVSQLGASDLVATDVVVLRQRARVGVDGATPGYGVVAVQLGEDPTTLNLQRAVFEGASTGIHVEGAGATATIEDVRFHDTGNPSEANAVGFGAMTVVGGTVQLRRAAIDETATSAIYVADAPGADLLRRARLTAEDISVRNVHSGPRGYGLGIGILSTDGATVDLHRFVGERIEGYDLIATDGSSIRVADAFLREGRPIPEILDLGGGAIAQGSSSLELDRVQLFDHRGVSLFAFGSSTIRGRDVGVESTRDWACADSTCSDKTGGSGVVSAARSAVELERFVIRDSALCGVMVDTEASLDLRIGEVSGAVIGACVQVPDYDVQRLQDQVRYRDNGLSLDATSLPVPEPIELP